MFYYQKIKKILAGGKIRSEEAVKLVTLYALKYNSHPNNDINGLISKLTNENNVSSRSTQVMTSVYWNFLIGNLQIELVFQICS